VHTLVVGDGFIPAGPYVSALRDRLGPDFGPVRAVDLPGDKNAQHERQQVMETAGPNAVDTPAELLTAVAGAEALCAHFAPVGEKLLAAALMWIIGSRSSSICLRRHEMYRSTTLV
jgi:hypothetical protein